MLTYSRKLYSRKGTATYEAVLNDSLTPIALEMQKVKGIKELEQEHKSI